MREARTQELYLSVLWKRGVLLMNENQLKALTELCDMERELFKRLKTTKEEGKKTEIINMLCVVSETKIKWLKRAITMSQRM